VPFEIIRERIGNLRTYYLLYWLLLSLFFAGCIGTKNLKQDEYLLSSQRIKGNKKVESENLAELYQQRPNRKVLKVFPISLYTWMYQTGANKFDSAKIIEKKQKIVSKYDAKIERHTGDPRKIAKLESRKTAKLAKKDDVLKNGNSFMQMGEPLSVYDSAMNSATIDQMTRYLHNKGFFHGEVEAEVKTNEKRKSVIYHVREGAPYTLDSLMLVTGDSAVTKLINSTSESSLLKSGQNYDTEKLDAEILRIENLMKDNGYYEFSRRMVEFAVDTAIMGDRRIAIKTIINNPSKRGFHKVFKVDTVIFTTDANVPSTKLRRDTRIYNRVTYRFFEEKYSKRILDRRLFIYPGDLYNKTKTFSTQRQLANLDMFKFVNINYDTTGNKFIANIFTSPLSRNQLTQEVGINVTANQRVPGPFYDFNFKNRNTFGGLEILEFNGRLGINGVASYSSEGAIANSRELGGNLSLTLPDFVFPLSNSMKSKLGELNPRTQFSLGYDFVNRIDFTRDNFSTSVKYFWQRGQSRLFTFALADLNLIDTRNISPEFQDELDESDSLGTSFHRAFEPSFVSSMYLQSIFDFNQYGTYQKNSSYLRTFVESGGTFLNVYGTSFLEKDSLENYQFVKLNIDYRKHIPLPLQGAVVAYRINAGVGIPYGDNDILPYEKNFFAGGSSSVRAWGPRRLGPGSYSPVNEEGIIDYNFEQPGEIILEASIEYRQKLVGFLDWALFFDAGNTWTIRDDVGDDGEVRRPGGKFENDFYKEIALGTGMGFRMDFTFLILRFDMGVKVYEPARPEGERWVLRKFKLGGIEGSTDNSITLNIGIGYPF
jgi:outer membrane protein assembly factor BamA